MKEPVISVLVAAYNVEQYVAECVISIMAQTYHNLEIIVVDDGSTDTTGQILDELAAKDPRIRVIHKVNEGLVMARRDALEAATGELVGFVDGDDWIDPDMYDNLYHTMKATGADIVTSGRVIEEKHRSFPLFDLVGEGEYFPKEDSVFCHNLIWDQNNHLWGVTPNFWNKLFKKCSIQPFQKNVNINITYGEDDACVYGALAFADKVTVLEKAFYHYRMRGDSMSHSADDYYMQKVNALYLDMKKSFEGHPYEAILKSGLDLYMFEFVKRGVQSLWGINVDCEIISNKLCGIDLDLNEKFVLYGAGKIGQELHREFCRLGMKKNIIWVDKQFAKYTAEGLPVERPDIMLTHDYKCVIVAVKRESLFSEIKSELIEMGVDTSKIQQIQCLNTIELCKRK